MKWFFYRIFRASIFRWNFFLQFFHQNISLHFLRRILSPDFWDMKRNTRLNTFFNHLFSWFLYAFSKIHWYPLEVIFKISQISHLIFLFFGFSFSRSFVFYILFMNRFLFTIISTNDGLAAVQSFFYIFLWTRIVEIVWFSLQFSHTQIWSISKFSLSYLEFYFHQRKLNLL